MSPLTGHVKEHGFHAILALLLLLQVRRVWGTALRPRSGTAGQRAVCSSFDSVTGGHRRLTHPLRVTACAHDVLVVPLWLTDCVCSCPIGRRRGYLRERRAACACGTRLTEAYRGHVRGRQVVLHE